jgi:hypothetical protein
MISEVFLSVPERCLMISEVFLSVPERFLMSHAFSCLFQRCSDRKYNQNSLPSAIAILTQSIAGSKTGA